MADEKFVTAINCMDGRVQEPAIAYLRKRFGADHVDKITEPGPVKILSENSDEIAVASIKRKVDISYNAHGSRVIAVFAHHDCAGNPVDRETQLKQIKDSIETIHSWGYDCEIDGFWIDENWTVNELD